MTQRAVIKERQAVLSQDFGSDIARKWFGDEIVDSLPKFVKGRNKGLTKAYVSWTKVSVGGWLKLRGYDGMVENRAGSVVCAALFIPSYRGNDKLVAIYTKDKTNPLEIISIKNYIQNSDSTDYFLNDYVSIDSVAGTMTKKDREEVLAATRALHGKITALKVVLDGFKANFREDFSKPAKALMKQGKHDEGEAVLDDYFDQRDSMQKEIEELELELNK